LEEMSHGFSEISSGIMEGCVLAIDGFGVKTHQPRFVCATCTHSGSTNDFIAWQDCDLFELLEVEKQLLDKYFYW